MKKIEEIELEIEFSQACLELNLSKIKQLHETIIKKSDLKIDYLRSFELVCTDRKLDIIEYFVKEIKIQNFDNFNYEAILSLVCANDKVKNLKYLLENKKTIVKNPEISTQLLEYMFSTAIDYNSYKVLKYLILEKNIPINNFVKEKITELYSKEAVSQIEDIFAFRQKRDLNENLSKNLKECKNLPKPKI